MSKPTIESSLQIPDFILKELLTAAELRMIKNRWLIINLLVEGLSIRQIAAQVKVGTDTVVRVAKLLEQHPKLRELINKDKDQPTRTAWVFGKSDE